MTFLEVKTESGSEALVAGRHRGENVETRPSRDAAPRKHRMTVDSETRDMLLATLNMTAKGTREIPSGHIKHERQEDTRDTV